MLWVAGHHNARAHEWGFAGLSLLVTIKSPVTPTHVALGGVQEVLLNGLRKATTSITRQKRKLRRAGEPRVSPAELGFKPREPPPHACVKTLLPPSPPLALTATLGGTLSSPHLGIICPKDNSQGPGLL